MSEPLHANDDSHWEAVIVGAGAAGLVAGATAAERGKRTLLVEKNRKPGVKILMSGGTRCNITHATDNRGIVDAFGTQGRFLHSALAALSVEQTIGLFESLGVATKTEATGKIFPSSDKATDVLAALLRWVAGAGCTLALDEALLKIAPDSDGFLLTTSQRTLHADKLLITSGGQSYPGCGTIGEGYRWAAQFGHTIVQPRPALVPITTNMDWVRGLQGITIPDVALRVLDDSQAGGSGEFYCLAQRRGSLLFTHFGLSGPVVLDVSREVSGHAPQSLNLECDFLPNMKAAALDQWLREQSATAGRRSLAGLLSEILPRRLCEAILSVARVSPEVKVAELSNRARTGVVQSFKAATISISGTMGFKKAEVTAGGVSLAEVDSRTMQSKLKPNLFFAGEVLDLDGPIGGYNFQAAWSAGCLAGKNL